MTTTHLYSGKYNGRVTFQTFLHWLHEFVPQSIQNDNKVLLGDQQLIDDMITCFEARRNGCLRK